MKSFPYVQEYRDNRGKIRRYFRRRGVRRALAGEPGSPAFMEGYTAALTESEAKAGPLSSKRPEKGTVGALVASYYASRAYLTLKPSTQIAYKSVIEPFRETHADWPVALMTRRWIEKEMGKQVAHKPRANNWLKRLRALWDHAIELEWTDANPARTIKLYKLGGGHKEWPQELIEQYQEFHPTGTMPRLALDLLLYTGQRRSDVVRMSKSHVRDGEIRISQKKTDHVLWVPLHPKLIASIAETPSKCTTYLCTEYNRPFSPDGFGNWFRKHCIRAKIPDGYSAHGLRKAAGYRLADAGCSTHQIMSVLGLKSISVAEIYTRGHDQKRLAREAVGRMK